MSLNFSDSEDDSLTPYFKNITSIREAINNKPFSPILKFLDSFKLFLDENKNTVSLSQLLSSLENRLIRAGLNNELKNYAFAANEE